MSFLAKNLRMNGSPITTKLPNMHGVPFGTIFSPHQVHIDWTKKGGWQDPQLIDFGNLSIPIQAGSLHYGLQCFEGLKAYYAPGDKTIRLFRPEMNAARMNRSMARLAFPTFDEKEWVQVLKELVKTDKDFVPREEGYTLYLRPGAIATNANLHVGPTDSVKLFMIASPVGPYYPDGFKPVKLVVDSKHKRAWPGGSGDCKIGPNYGPTIMHQVEHAKKGFPQVLWLGAKGEINEVGAMNFMVLWKNKNGDRELITPALDGTILPGVTRDSILKLTAAWNEFKVTEGVFTIDELMAALKEGRVEEVFGCGTAAIVTAVNGLHMDGQDFAIPIPEKSTAQRILNELSDIQYGRKESPWSVVVC